MVAIVKLVALSRSSLFDKYVVLQPEGMALLVRLTHHEPEGANVFADHLEAVKLFTSQFSFLSSSHLVNLKRRHSITIKQYIFHERIEFDPKMRDCYKQGQIQEHSG